MITALCVLIDYNILNDRYSYDTKKCMLGSAPSLAVLQATSWLDMTPKQLKRLIGLLAEARDKETAIPLLMYHHECIVTSLWMISGG